MTDPQTPSGAQPNQPGQAPWPQGPQPGQSHAQQQGQGPWPQGPQPGHQPPPPYQQAQYGQGPVPPPYAQQYFQGPPKPPSKAPMVLIIIGAILLALGIGCGIVFGIQLGALIPSASSLVRVDGSAEVTVTGDEMKVIFASDPSVSCDVTGPGDTQPDVWLNQSMKFTTDGVSFEAIGKIGGPGEASGTYTIQCDGPGVVIAPPLSVGGIGAAVIAAVIGGLAGVTGLILLIIGLVLKASQRKRARA